MLGLKDLILAPPEYIDFIEASWPGWTNAMLLRWSAWIDSRLAKRYATPFVSPYPVAVTGWLAQVMDREIYLKRGVDPTDAQFSRIDELATLALTELKEASDAQYGLFDLPLRGDNDSSGITKGEPLSYSEASPYTWTWAQLDLAQGEFRGR